MNANIVIMVVSLVAIACFLKIAVAWLNTRAQQEDAAATARAEATQKRLDDLENRVRILERIATDKSHRLKEEIDNL